MLAKRRFSVLAVGLALVAAIMLAGCSSSSNKSVNSGGNPFNQAFGGLSATNESPAFGDPTLMSMSGDADAHDNMMGSSDLDSLIHGIGVNVFSVEFRWGHLQVDSTETVVTDWSGSLTIQRGAIVAIRTIGFDTGDHLVMPRHSRTELDWVSHTKEASDGILVYVYDPTGGAYYGNNFTFTTTPYTRTINTTGLDSLSDLVNVGNNQVSINILKVTSLDCSGGFLDGRFIRSELDRDTGVFMGRWLSRGGLLFGHYRGRFGVRDDGTRVMYGKWISAGPPDESDAAGTFHGLLSGTWGYDANVDPVLLNHGWFLGDIYNGSQTIIGHYSGTWVAVAPASNGGIGNGGGMGGGTGGGYGGYKLTGSGSSADNVNHKGFGFMTGDWTAKCQ
jgi:hypothetical protein